MRVLGADAVDGDVQDRGGQWCVARANAGPSSSVAVTADRRPVALDRRADLGERINAGRRECRQEVASSAQFGLEVPASAARTHGELGQDPPGEVFKSVATLVPRRENRRRK